jgi:hypothetical protein
MTLLALAVSLDLLAGIRPIAGIRWRGSAGSSRSAAPARRARRRTVVEIVRGHLVAGDLDGARRQVARHLVSWRRPASTWRGRSALALVLGVS